MVREEPKTGTTLYSLYIYTCFIWVQAKLSSGEETGNARNFVAYSIYISHN